MAAREQIYKQANLTVKGENFNFEELIKAIG
jgi:hypothetical protein